MIELINLIAPADLERLREKARKENLISLDADEFKALIEDRDKYREALLMLMGAAIAAEDTATADWIAKVVKASAGLT